MSFVATAIAGTAVVGAVGTMVAGSQAAGAITNSTNASIASQQQALQQQTALNAPYAAIGTGGGGNTGAIQQYQNLLGLGPQGTAGEEAALAATPGYQFTKDQGTQATINAAAGQGMSLSGNTLEGLSKFNAGLADQTYQSAVGNAQNAVTIGQNAAANTGAATQNTANNISSAQIGAGQNIAGIDANTIAGITKSVSGGANQYLTAANAGLLNPSTPDYGTPYATLGGPGANTITSPGADYLPTYVTG